VAEYVVLREEFSVKLDPERWLFLSAEDSLHWHFQISGPEPLVSDFNARSANEAQEHAADVAATHLRRVKPEITLPATLTWRTAVAAFKPVVVAR
jgi:hypothetical protein